MVMRLEPRQLEPAGSRETSTTIEDGGGRNLYYRIRFGPSHRGLLMDWPGGGNPSRYLKIQKYIKPWANNTISFSPSERYALR
jgi:hypothetical protein